jgi:hypothetical protein
MADGSGSASSAAEHFWDSMKALEWQVISRSIRREVLADFPVHLSNNHNVLASTTGGFIKASLLPACLAGKERDVA